MKYGRWILSVLTVLGAAGAQAQSLSGLDRFVEAEMVKESAPGLALVVIKDGTIVHQRGYGFRDVEHKLPVTPNTLFAIGSVTKSFTVIALGGLAQQGQFDWDRRVRSYLPDFQLQDAYATEHMTPRDLVTHRSGLPRHDGVWYGNTLKRADYYQRLRFLAPSAEFRSLYQYNNLMFVTAGYLAERISGLTWEQLVEQRIFKPLGMTRSYPDIAAFQRDPEPALPYSKSAEGGVLKIDYRNIDAIGPAGSINSTVVDMARYLRTLMNGGSVDGRQVMDAATVREMQSPQTIVPDTSRYAEDGRSQYGMGLTLATYRGHNVVSHVGNIDGFTAYMGWLPQERIGVVLLINLDGSQLRPIVSRRVFDLALGLKPIDWSARYTADKELRKSSDVAENRPGISVQKQGTSPAHPLDEYVGSYMHPAYGTVSIERNAQGLKLSQYQASSALRHFHYEVFEAPEDNVNPLSGRKVQFNTAVDGEVTSLSIVMEPAVDAIVFNRIGGAQMHEPAFLSQFVGTYQIGTDIVRVTLLNGSLTIGINDEVKRRLLPFRGTRFVIEGRRNSSVEFMTSGQLVYRRPGGAAVGVRSERADSERS